MRLRVATAGRPDGRSKIDMWMNEWEIDNALDRWRDHPLLGPAVLTLSGLRDEVNRCSDGWPYWLKPANAAKKLMDLIGQADKSERERYQLPRAPMPTERDLKAAYTPLKAFRTRQGMSFGIVQPAGSPNEDQLV